MSRQKKVYADIESSVLKWAFESSGWELNELSKRLKVTPETFNRWIDGSVKPTITQLEDVAHIVKRPLAAFFLPSPPVEAPLPPDFRMMPNKKDKFDKKTLLAIRRARRLQHLGKELSENLSSNINAEIIKANLNNKPSDIAEKYRSLLKFDEIVFKNAKDPYTLYRILRELIEEKNILVFQISMPLDDARGFALTNGSPSIIVVNSKDCIEARIFTLIHELGHLALNEPGVSIPENSILNENGDGIEKVEKWCNEFASSFLIPDAIAKREFGLFSNKLTDTDTLKKLSKKFKLSKAMILYKMRKMNLISFSEYKSVVDRYKPSNAVIIRAGKKFRGAKADQRVFNERGQKFVSLVANNVEKGFITHKDALSYLSIKSKNLDKVISKSKK